MAADGGALVEVLVPARPTIADVAAGHAPDAEVGARVPVRSARRRGWRDVLDRIVAGRLVVFDYMASTSELAARPEREWLRTFVGHERGGPPLERPGSQDITTEVPLDQLGRSRAPDAVRARRSSSLATASTSSSRRAGGSGTSEPRVGDLAAMRARSRVREAEALGDPSGLGGFSVVEWVVSEARRPELCDNPRVTCSALPRPAFVSAPSGGKNVHQ